MWEVVTMTVMMMMVMLGRSSSDSESEVGKGFARRHFLKLKLKVVLVQSRWWVSTTQDAPGCLFKLNSALFAHHPPPSRLDQASLKGQ